MFSKYELFIHDQLDSTNTEARRLAKSGYIKNAVILAHKQTAARGKNGRPWVSIRGNLQCTIILSNIQITLKNQAFFCFIVGLAVHSIISSLTLNKYNISLKWPNDVMVNDKKISGILLESITLSKIPYLFIGIGINIVSSPQNIDRPTTCLYELGVPDITPQHLLSKLIAKFEEYCNLWKLKGNEYIIEEWRKKAYKLNEQIIFKHDENNIVNSVDVVTSSEKSTPMVLARVTSDDVAISNQLTIKGIFRDINSNGDILIETNDKELLNFSIGEIFSLT